MSKESIKTIKDNELQCYVCLKQIKILQRLRAFANKKKTEIYDSLKVVQLRHKVNQKVMEVTATNDVTRRFRHSRCNPVEKQFSVEDL